MSQNPNRHKEWWRQKVWPFPKRVSEGADSILPHVEEFLDQSKRLKDKEQEATQEKPGREKPSKH
jgi:hypothetical protein